jgi:ATP-dependent Clp protease ATP-binding subunit ClpX
MAEKKKTLKPLNCSFCNKDQADVRKLIAGPDVFICDECIELCNGVLQEELPSVVAKETKDGVPTPAEIKRHLDSYVIGQDSAKRTMA